MFFISSINKTKYDYIAKPFSKEQIQEILDIIFELNKSNQLSSTMKDDVI